MELMSKKIQAFTYRCSSCTLPKSRRCLLPHCSYRLCSYYSSFLADSLFLKDGMTFFFFLIHLNSPFTDARKISPLISEPSSSWALEDILQTKTWLFLGNKLSCICLRFFKDIKLEFQEMLNSIILKYPNTFNWGHIFSFFKT